MSYTSSPSKQPRTKRSDWDEDTETRVRRKADKEINKQHATLKSLRLDRRSPKEIMEALSNED